MSERESGVGSFMLGIAVGAVLALLFAPEAGTELRDELGRRLRSLRELAEEKVGELGELMSDDEEPERRIAPPPSRKRRRRARPPRV